MIKFVKNDDDTARILNTSYSNIVSDFKIPDCNNCDTLVENIQELISKVIEKCRNHPSILTIRELCKNNPQISFRCVDKGEVLKETLNLDASKVHQDLDIPSRIIKENADIFADFLYSSFNNSIYQSEFPSILKLANIISDSKKGYRNSKENQRPVSIFPKFSKFFERCMF